MPALRRRQALALLLAGSGACLPPAGAATSPPARPLLKPARLKEGDTIGLVAPSAAVFHRASYEFAHEGLTALGFKVREAPNLRQRRGHLAGTDEQRAADLNAFFADPGVHALWALGGGSGAARLLPRLDYAAIARTPKVLCGYSDATALLNGIHARTGLVTFHGPFASSDWNEFDLRHWKAVVMEGATPTLSNPPDREDRLVPREGRTRTLRAGVARGRLFGGNLAVLAGLAGSSYLPAPAGGLLFLEDTNEYLYRVDRMLTTLKLAGLFDGLAGVVVGACSQCTPGDGYGSLTLEEILDDHLLPLNVPAYSGAAIGHIRRKFTLPIGVPAEVDATLGVMRLLEAAVS